MDFPYERLFDRTTRHVALTEAGQILLRYITQIEGLLQQAAQELADLNHLDRAARSFLQALQAYFTPIRLTPGR